MNKGMYVISIGNGAEVFIDGDNNLGMRMSNPQGSEVQFNLGNTDDGSLDTLIERLQTLRGDTPQKAGEERVGPILRKKVLLDTFNYFEFWVNNDMTTDEILNEQWILDEAAEMIRNQTIYLTLIKEYPEEI